MVVTVATVHDVAVELGRADPDTLSVEAEQWGVWLDDAEMQIEIRLGPVANLDQRVVAFVERSAVAAKVSRPDPVTSTSRQVTIDDGMVQTSAAYSRSSGLVEILPEWWDLLTPDDGSAFTIGPAVSVRSRGAEFPWCSL